MKYLKNLIEKICCLHQWDKVDESTKVRREDPAGVPLGYTSIYCCKKCGKFKKIEIF